MALIILALAIAIALSGFAIFSFDRQVREQAKEIAALSYENGRLQEQLDLLTSKSVLASPEEIASSIADALANRQDPAP